MDSKTITVRTPADLLERIDAIAAQKQMTRSALVVQVIEEFAEKIQKRGYIIPPYEGDDILNDLRLGKRRRQFPSTASNNTEPQE